MTPRFRHWWLVVLLAAVHGPLTAAPDEAEDFAALQTVLAEEPAPEDFKSAEKAMAWDQAHALRVIGLAEKFLADYPQSPRRRAAQLAVAGAVASADGLDPRQQHYRRAEPLIDALLADPALTDDEWRVVAGTQIEGRLTGLRQLPPPGPDGAWRVVEARLGEFAQRAGDGRRYAALVSFYALTLVERDPARAPGVLQELEKSSVPRIAQFARGQLQVLRLVGQRADLKFTALDGREFDLARLRGKVVLVDFWATWCGPCIAELPNVKKVYAAYHERGFEVVGVALERAGLAPNDSAEAIAAKIEKAKKVLTGFVAKEQLPWPQYFDGRHWKTEPALHFGITAIPAMLLIDQRGTIVTTNARGEKLETEVKRLLRL